MKIYHPLKPIYTKDSKILILGSIPSVVSRKQNFYYANPNNRFWKILEVLFAVKLTTTEEKISFLNQHHIALWDVIKSCNIKGSSDSSIQNSELNDISSLLKQTKIKYIFCTGKKAYELFKKNFSYKCYYLPSPSSANATYSLEKLVHEYAIIRHLTNLK